MAQEPMRYTGPLAQSDDGSRIVKKGRHRRYEEARAMKRGPDLDIEALLSDLGNDPLSSPVDRSEIGGDIESDTDDYYDRWDDGDAVDEDEYHRDDEYSDR